MDKLKLQQIIREEIQNVLNENFNYNSFEQEFNKVVMYAGASYDKASKVITIYFCKFHELISY